MKKTLLIKLSNTVLVNKRTLYLLPFLIFINLASSYAATENFQVEKLTLNLKNISIKEIIKEIESKSSFVFIQSGLKKDELNKKVNLNVVDKTISDLCESILTDTTIKYKIINKQVVLYHVEKKENIISRFFQELFSISGTITDETGAPISGVTIVLKKDPSIWTVTDFDGKYKLSEIPKGSIVKVLSMGFLDQEIVITASGVKNLVLKEDIESLDEVIVTSNYGTAQKKSNLVSSAYQIKSEDIVNLPQQRLDKVLEGVIPGLEINPQSNGADSSRPRYSVTIRGEASLSASNEPLWIVDGIPINTGNNTNQILGIETSVSPLSFINPDDIESMTVLKDASATTIYGADGANGVILITTKKGKANKTQLNVSLRSGISFINKNSKFKVLNSEQYLELAKESFLNAGNDINYFPFTDNDMNAYSTTNTDWYDVFFDVGSTSQINLSASGGSEKATYRISGSYFANNMTVKGNKQERITLNSNNTVNISDKLSLDFTLLGSYNINSTFTPNSDYYENLPIISPYNADGTFRQYYKIIEGNNPDGSPRFIEKRFFNSVAEREQNDNGQNAFSFKSAVQLNYQINNDISLSSQFGVDYNNYNEKRYNSMYNWSGNDVTFTYDGYANSSSANFLNWNTIHRVNYNKQIGLHQISGVVGIELGANKYNSTSAWGNGFINDHIRTVGLAAFSDGSSSESETTKSSYLAQLSYSYDDRYNLILNGRNDGNSNFGTNVQRANFLSAGASWNIHKEAFFDSDIINILNIKASYGTNGNSRFGSQDPDGIYSVSDSYQYGGDLGAGISSGANPDLSWETTYLLNLGLRVAMFNNRLDISTEVYRNKTVDLISNFDASRTTGTTTLVRNLGEIENKGIEVTLESKNIQTNNFKWNTRIITSHNQNKLLALYQDIPKNSGNYRLEIGKSTKTFYLMEWAGVDPQDGYPMWYDTEGNITKDFSLDNRVANKTEEADLFGSMTNTFSYKNKFNFSITTGYTIGGYSFSSFARDVNSDGLNIGDDNQSINQLDRWQSEGDLALATIPLWGVTTSSTRSSTRFLYSKTNVKIQNASFSYLFNNKVVQSLGLQSMSASLIGNNLLVWTPYDKSNRNSYKNNISGYPLETEISLGLNVTF
ncbi:SusC/RagA family TonB-linked outer membrane protein [Polaribacter sp. HaHaR_3_91]|uniref:SusC/RagA family TonB-linked outer membrane protein n=1 Tax=Polaribacter sp. HaHaR_3_91 TaxID=2745561 RepID=UPI001C4F67E3|nr:SusC/RagA family TonB-linked outer membrane protein [Polaribacter sp. HaHaR_3_91]QXP63226.1 SusC/RagA family TonB-linked outer membrane protein [Polaribacter sp. HaHaR_3_91]